MGPGSSRRLLRLHRLRLAEQSLGCRSSLIMALQVFSAFLIKDTVARTWEKLFTSECAQCR